MYKDRLDPGQSAQPALMVTFGNTNRKHRPLDRDIMVLGRSTGCDVVLSAPEVAPVQCIIVRVGSNWRIRDVAGRSNTRLNGKAIQEEPLCDADTLQIGSFSFEVSLPGRSVNGLRGPGSANGVLAGSPQVEHLKHARQNLARLALNLRSRLQRAESNRQAQLDSMYDHQQSEFEEKAQDLHCRQIDLEMRMSKLERSEHDLKAARAAFEAEKARQTADVEARVKAAREEGLQEGLNQMASVVTVPSPVVKNLAQASPEERDLELRRLELDQYAQYLQRTRQQQDKQREEMAQALEQLLNESGNPSGEPVSAGKNGAEDHSVALSEVNSRLDSLQETIQTRDNQVASLEKALQARDTLVSRLQRQLEQKNMHLEQSGGYEAELAQFRQELERDRELLNEQISELQIRFSELEQTSREAELQMSQERAQIARERTELTRLQEEIRHEQRRRDRKSGVRDRLAPLDRLKEELAEKRQPVQGKGQSKRWKNTLGRSNGAQS
jgi:hypothetical protein